MPVGSPLLRRARLLAAIPLAATALAWSPPAAADLADDVAAQVGLGGDELSRPLAAPVVMTGLQLRDWSEQPAVAVVGDFGASLEGAARNAHAGTVEVPPSDGRAGVKPDEVVAFRRENGRWVEIPVQIDERYPYFLANASSDFGMYSRTDVELTYAWDAERWNWTGGVCNAEPRDAMPDPVPAFDDDDELVFMPEEAGDQAATSIKGPAGTGSTRQEIAIADPLQPGVVRYVYLFTRQGGSAFDATNGYVSYDRDANADQWIDKSFFGAGDPEALGTSNGGYGPNLSGTVCPDGTEASQTASSDRFVRDGVTVSTSTYRWRATGRWMVRDLRVAAPDGSGEYGPDLIDRWKGRAFQQSPDSTVSLVGFEDEQVNWEANSTLLGERAGPVRAIREVWGADSGTNVTKTETFYRDAITYRYHLRVHPIPPDGLYTSWDYNRDVASTYYTPVRPLGVAIDGVNDDVGNVDDIGGAPAFFDAPDPSLNVPISLLTWEQVSGKGDSGSLVYLFENKGPTSLTEPLVVPYYRDDACLDDGTGDDPVARPWPGEASTDPRVRDGYVSAAGVASYDELECSQRQGAHASHGVHFFATGDTDNAFLPSPQPVNEVDAQQWQFMVPTESPRNVGHRYAMEVRAPLVAVAQKQQSTPVAATQLTISAPAEVQATDGFDVTVTLAGAPAGSAVALAFGSEAISVTTDSLGAATASFVAGGPAGPRSLTASYAGDAESAPSSASSVVTVIKDEAVVSVGLSGLRPATTVAVALRDPDSGAGLAGRLVTIAVNGAAVTQVTTSGNGTGSAVLALKRGDVVTATFGGDDTYLAASASSTRS